MIQTLIPAGLAVKPFVFVEQTPERFINKVGVSSALMQPAFFSQAAQESITPFFKKNLDAGGVVFHSLFQPLDQRLCKGLINIHPPLVFQEMSFPTHSPFHKGLIAVCLREARHGRDNNSKGDSLPAQEFRQSFSMKSAGREKCRIGAFFFHGGKKTREKNLVASRSEFIKTGPGIIRRLKSLQKSFQRFRQFSFLGRMFLGRIELLGIFKKCLDFSPGGWRKLQAKPQRKHVLDFKEVEKIQRFRILTAQTAETFLNKSLIL